MTTFGSHAYWRVQCLNPANGFIAFSAFLFKDDVASSIATTGGSAIESGHFSTFSSSALFDGTDATFWESSNQFFSWAGYHFSSPQTVMQVGLQRTASMDGSSPPAAVIVQYSDDGITWGSAGWLNVGTLTNDVPTWFNLSGALP